MPEGCPGCGADGSGDDVLANDQLWCPNDECRVVSFLEEDGLRADGGAEPTGTEHQRVVGHLWWSDHLEVAVHDAWIGRTFRVQFTQAVDGVLKHSGGGAYGGSEEERFNLAEATAAQWVREQFGYRITDKRTWSRVKALRGMQHRDQQELAKLSEEERRELARQLRTGEIDLSSEDEDGDGNCSTDTGTTRSGGDDK